MPAMDDQAPDTSPGYRAAVSIEQPSRAAPAPARTLTPAAERALAEAAARRAAFDAKAKALAENPELHGRGGADPVRYDDWEIGGIAVDF